MDFTDKRKGKIVYVSQCILNQNLRFPGIAVSAGACTEVVDLFVRKGIGIEPIPCLERLGWGGVSRKDYFRYQPLILRFARSRFFGLVKPLIALWLYRYRLLCAREARKIVRQIADYIRSGYSVIGIVAVNDSPTDGVTKTIDLSRAPVILASKGIDPKLMNNPKLDDMKKILAELCQDGVGIFIARLMHELGKKKIPLSIVGYDPWLDPKAESARIAAALDLQG
jgi:predicted secreted protein